MVGSLIYYSKNECAVLKLCQIGRRRDSLLKGNRRGFRELRSISILSLKECIDKELIVKIHQPTEWSPLPEIPGYANMSG